MKQLIWYIFLLNLLFSCNIKNQSEVETPDKKSRTLSINDTTSYYYSKTNYDLIDTLDCWNYELDKNYKPDIKDSVQPMALLTFFRTKPLYDSISLRIYKKPWTPYMSFEVFSLKDSSYCFQESGRIRFLSSCSPPGTGGDIFIIGNFVFLNRDVCLQCVKFDSGTDYCRPLINYLIGKIDKNKVSTIDNIVNQFPITISLPVNENQMHSEENARMWYLH